MFKKGNRYYADWRDADGKRLRRSFTNATDATKFEEERRAEAHPKTKASEQPSPRSYGHSSRRKARSRATRRASPKSSPKLRARSARRSSPRTTSRKRPRARIR